MMEFGELCNLAAPNGGEGPEGTAPKTVDPLEFVVFNTDELVLQACNPNPNTNKVFFPAQVVAAK